MRDVNSDVIKLTCRGVDMNELFERLVDYIYTIRGEYPEVESEKLYGDGRIVYANGEDGSRTCWLVHDFFLYICLA